MFNLNLENSVGVTTEGAPAMVGERNGIAALLDKYCKENVNENAMLKRVHHLKDELDFMGSKGMVIPQFTDSSFLVDITGHLNILNFHLLGKTQLINVLFEHFKIKLRLWENQIQ